MGVMWLLTIAWTAVQHFGLVTDTQTSYNCYAAFDQLRMPLMSHEDSARIARSWLAKGKCSVMKDALEGHASIMEEHIRIMAEHASWMEQFQACFGSRISSLQGKASSAI